MSAFRDMIPVSLDGPPRRIAPRLAFRMRLGSNPALVGWLLLTIALAAMPSALRVHRREGYYEGAVETRTGHVLGVERLREGKDRHLSETIRVVFGYEERVGGEESESGVSYADTWDPPEDGTRVDVEVPVGHPGEARIRGMRISEDHHALLAVCLIVVAGLITLGLSAWFGGRQLRRLLYGRVTQAGLVSHYVSRFFLRKNGHMLTVDYDDHRDVTYQLSMRVYRLQRILDQPLKVIHDDSLPPRAQLLAALPGAPILGDDNVFRDDAEALDFLASFLVPVACIGLCTLLLVRTLFA